MAKICFVEKKKKLSMKKIIILKSMIKSSLENCYNPGDE